MFRRFRHRRVKKLLGILITQGEKIMATQEELAAELSAVNDQVAKIGGETAALLTKIEELSAAVAAAGQTTPEVDAAIAALKAQAQIVDDLVPDA